MKRQYTELETILANYILNKGLVFGTNGNFLQFNNKKIKSPIKKWAKDFNGLSPKKLHEWTAGIWKDSQHHSSLGSMN